MSEKTNRPEATPRAVDPADAGGDPACWLHRVCVECGLFLEDQAAPRCPRCGTPIDLP